MYLTPTRALASVLLSTLAINAAAQQAPTPAASAKSFDVVSIRRNVEEGARKAPMNLSPAPDGINLVRTPFITAIITAYTPQGSDGGMFGPDHIGGVPEWGQRENYDITARVSDADRAAWNDPKNQPAMLQQMLQALLADRFHLKVRTEMRPQNIYSLRVAKGGPKFQESRPGEPHPGATVLPGGALAESSDGLVHYYNTPIATFTSLISFLAGRSVRDDTGLTGRFDLTFPQPAPDRGVAPDSSDTRPSLFSVLAGLGLKLEPAKGETEFLVIDHVERPTEN